MPVNQTSKKEPITVSQLEQLVACKADSMASLYNIRPVLTTGELCPNDYRLLLSPRSAGRGGGLGLLYKQGIGSKTRLFEHSFTSFECIDATFVARV